MQKLLFLFYSLKNFVSSSKETANPFKAVAEFATNVIVAFNSSIEAVVSSVAAAFSSDIAERFSIIPTTVCLASSQSFVCSLIVFVSLLDDFISVITSF